ncbi:dehydrogenase/reductase SDR family member FEY-like [Eucalyptus grandis]|uniref:dehydrogenase/reductase SDR family member FEY-like n=1 Tax=Eucalyptus grandis TaxID=71139 RepID=UPI00192E8F51|nr:dehydrogenase/reductase SDR family member FEY-like [Eucalyptus grandis]
MACQRVDGAKKIAKRWKETGDIKTLHVEVMELDLLSLSSVRQSTVEWDQSGKPLHILINNAGILLLGGIISCCCVESCSLLLLPIYVHHWGAVEPKSWKIGANEEHKFSSLMSYGSSKLAQEKWTDEKGFMPSLRCLIKASHGIACPGLEKVKVLRWEQGINGARVRNGSCWSSGRHGRKESDSGKYPNIGLGSRKSQT